MNAQINDVSTEIANLSNEKLKKLGLEIKKINSSKAPASNRRSSLLKNLMDSSHYHYYMDKLSYVYTMVRIEIVHRFFEGDIK